MSEICPNSVGSILTLDINKVDDSKILTAGDDKHAIICNKDTERVVAKLKGHSEKLTKAIYHPNEDTVITGSLDKSIRIWHVPTSRMQLLLNCHDGPVTDLSLHFLGDYILSTSSDKHWVLSDVRTGRLLTKNVDTAEKGLTTIHFHPCGRQFATGAEDSQVDIWDLKLQTNVASFSHCAGPISAISFSKNYLATAANDACVKLWDIRKLESFKTIQLDKGYIVNDLHFDQSSTYLAIAGTDVRIYLCKNWQNLHIFNNHKALATGVRFGKNAEYIASASLDGTIQLYGAV